MTSKSAVPLAIIGMGCKLPGADNLEQFWRLVVEGRNAVVELPPDRLDQDMYYDERVGVVGQTYSKLGAIVSSREFDRRACPIPDSLERSVDNAHLLMCGVAADALRHAGIDPFNVPLRNTGVYIGHAQGSTLGGDYTYATYAEEAAEMLREVGDFQSLPAEQQSQVIAELLARIRSKLPERAADSPDVACSLVAGTISKAFNLSGPFLALNSACASSLQAMLIGARALQLGQIDMAIVGGASDCKSDSLVLFAHARAMSSTGSRPFDESADGLIVGEGYVALVMKTLERALADGDPIQAVVRGLGVSSDGKGKSLWAPRKEGQVLAMQRAYRDGLDFRDLDYVEAHATATQLGDATELNTLAEVLKDKLPPGKKVPITSVKANIGHTLETAGIAGVIKTVLALKHNTIPPAASIKDLNPKIDWANVPVYVPREPAPWPAHADGRPRRAGVNAFGIGGLNMHAVIEEFNDASRELVKKYPLAGAYASDDDAVAVIGMGCVLPGARDLPAFWNLLTSGRDAKSEAPADRWRTDLAYEAGSRKPFKSPTKRGGFITDFEYDWKLHKIPPKQVQQADPLQFMLLDASDQALKNAGYETKPFDRTRVGVVVGTEFGGDFAFQLQMGLRLPEIERHLEAILTPRGVPAAQIAAIQKAYNKTLLAHWPALIDETGSFSTSSLASRTAKTWNLMGGAVAIDSGHCSGLASLSVSADMLLTGDCDMVICAAGHRRLGLPAYEALALNGMLAQDGTSANPLDAGATGYLPADGVGVLLLKRLSDARRDGDQIHAVIRGIGAAHDQSPGAALQSAIERSLRDAGDEPVEINLLEVDGTLLTDSGPEQLSTIANMYASAPRQQPLVLSSVVGQIGHPESAAGVVSLIKSSLELERGVVPPTFGVNQPNPTVSRPNQLIVAQSETRLAGEHRLAAVCSRSRGLTYHAVIEHGAAKLKPRKRREEPTVIPKYVAPAAPVAATSGSWRLYRFAAASPSELLSQLGQARANVDATAQQPERAFSASDRFRAAIVADSPATLATRLDAAIAQGAQTAAHPVLRQQGIFFAEQTGQKPQVVFCFPGQGSQYDGMLRSLVNEVPEVSQALAEVEQVLERYGYQSFADLAWGNSSALGTKVWPTQLSVLVADWLMQRAMTAHGIQADAMLGHSFGEYAALAASGAVDFETALALTRARCDGIAAARVEGGLLATTASAQQVAELAKQSGLEIFVANFNAPDQTVVGGKPQALAQFEGVLKQNKINSKALAVPAPFHTPLMAPANAALTRALADAPVSAPRVPVWSVVTNSPVTSGEQIRENLSRHNISPVMYVELIQKVAGGRPTVFVEVGPQQVLTNLNRRILTREQAYAIPSDQPKRPGREQVLHVRALLESLGVYDTAAKSAPAKPAAAPVAKPAAAGPREVWTFDATARRREKMRQAALAGKNKTAKSAAAPPAAATPAPPAPIQSAQPSPPPVAPPPAPPAPPAAKQAVAPPEAAQTAPSTNGAATPKSAAKSSAVGPDLEKFLINFVVEQTGYPPEVVELDADLEADLGIDSIKKAQLFGELQEYFDVVPTEDLTLDHFPTLRHVLDFLRKAPLREGAPESIEAAPAAAASPAPQPTPVASAAAAPAPVPATVATTTASDDELEKFLINFVVEQTGYPPEVVELDADLEADLGIDSIKKAQLFGELQEYFDVVPTEDLTLDHFPTLRHVLDFLRKVPRRGGEAAPVATSAPSVAPAAHVASVPTDPQPVAVAPQPVSAVATPAETAGPDADELEKFLINFVVEQTGYPPEVVELDADLEADLGIDSIKKAQLFGELQEYFDVVPTEDLTLDHFPSLRHVLDFLRKVPRRGGEAAPVASSPAPAAPSAPEPVAVTAVSAPLEPAPAPQPAATSVAAPSSDELEQFLINFVVEQTGYPPEVVELDADLEADLGIDSIKKAQLFGELQEYFDVVPTEDLTLDHFPTLRHVLDFLRKVPRRGGEASPELNGHATNGQTNGHAADPFATNGHAAVVNEAPAEPATTGEAVELEGTPYEMGLAHGRRYRHKIRRILRTYADLTGQSAGELPLPSGDLTRFFTSEELDELQGIADGAEVTLANVLVHNLVASSDLGQANLRFAAREAEGGTVHAAGWSLPLLGALADVIQPAIFVRRPTFGVEHAVVSVVGTVGALAGVNAAGISASAVADPSAEAGSWTLAVRRSLETARDAQSATEALRPADALLVDDASGEFRHAAQSETDALLIVSAEAGDEAFAATRERFQEIASAAKAKRYPTVALVAETLRHAPSLATVGAGVSVSNGDLPGQLLSVIFDSKRREFTVTGLSRAAASRTIGPVTLPAWRNVPPRDTKPTTRPVAKSREPGRPAGLAGELPPAPEGSEAAARFTLRTIPQAFPAGVANHPAWAGAAIVVGDNPVADALEAQIQKSGATVQRVRHLRTPDEATTALEAIWAKGAAPHLFLTSSRDESPPDLWNPEVFRARFEELVVTPFFLTQAWVTKALDAKLLNQAAIVAVTRLGGDFGFGGQHVAPEGGALTGLMKALCLELNVMRTFKQFLAKAIDAPDDEPAERFATNILRELAHGAIDYEVAFPAGERHLQNGIPAATRASEPAAQIAPVGQWIITGGARGITAECARELGQRFGLSLRLVGSSPVPKIPAEWLDLDDAALGEIKAQAMRDAVKAKKKPGEAWEPVQKAIEITRNLRDLRASGLDVTYHSCDVADPRAVSALLNELRRNGPITGVLHGAGIERSCRFEKKSRAGFDATFGSKVLGAYNFMALTRQDPIRHFLGFGSISGRLGSNGQADYCAASDMLAKLTSWYAQERPECRSLTFHWHPWDEVGMAYRPETRATLQMTNGPTLMPKREGLAHLAREVASGSTDYEVIITTPEYFERYYGPGSATTPVEGPGPVAATTYKLPDPIGALPPTGDTVAFRNALRMKSAPLDDSSRAALVGSACILGDNADALALEAALQGAGVPVTRLTPSENADELIARAETAWNSGLPRHLFLLTARDPEAGRLDSREAVARRRELGLVAPYLLVQRWLRRLNKEALDSSPTLTAVTNLGGDFAIQSNDIAPEGGWMAGFFKSVHVEGNRRQEHRLRCRVLDFSASESPSAIASAVLAEVTSNAGDVEVGYRAGVRSIVEVYSAPVDVQRREITRGGAWIVTGGARGITAASALHLGQRYGLKLHLVGASPVPDLNAPWIGADDARLKEIKAEIVRKAVAEGRSPEEDWLRVKKAREITESLDKFRAAGVTATYHSCDMGDWDAVAKLLADVRRQEGAIHGIIHGAGYAKSARAEMKSRPILERTTKPKFDGALALMLLSRADRLEHFITYGSLSGRFGGNGLSDYAAANEALAKLSAWYRGLRPEVGSACIAWQTWDEIGMAMLSDSAGINRNALQMAFIPPAEGVAHLEREILSGEPDAEIVVTDGFFEKHFYRGEELEAPPRSPLTAPLVDSLGQGSEPGTTVAALRFDPTTDPFLIDHRLRSAPFLPGVVALESLAEAARLTAPESEVVSLTDVEIVQGIKFQPDRPMNARVTLSGSGATRRGALTVEVRDRRERLVDAARPCASGTIELGQAPPKIQAVAPTPPVEGWFQFSYSDDALLWHGPRFRYLKEGNYGADGGFGRIIAPPVEELAGNRCRNGWIVPLAVLDACVVACGSFIFLSFGGRLEVPFRFEELRIARQPAPGERSLLRFDLRERRERNSVFDFTLFGAAGDPVLAVRGYTTVVVA